MAGRGQALGMVVAVAVSATLGIAALVGAEPAPGPAAPVAMTSSHRPAVLQRPAALPSVSTHNLDPAMMAAVTSAPAEGGQSVTETIELSIIGGDLTLVTDQASVTLERVPGTRSDWTGTLPPVRVIDATGSGAGWDVRWAVSSLDVQAKGKASHVPDAKVHLDPGAPVVVAGLPDGVTAGTGGPAVQKGRTLFSARPDSGGGTYEDGGTISVRLPASVDATDVVVGLTFSLG